MRIVQNTERLLALFNERQAKATFFVLGYVAEQHPQFIREIAEAGHEIATHGYTHQLVYQQIPAVFKRTLAKPKSALKILSAKASKNTGPLLGPSLQNLSGPGTF